MRQIYALTPFFPFSLLSKTSIFQDFYLPKICQLPPPIPKSKLPWPKLFAANHLLSQPSSEGPKVPTFRYLLCIPPKYLTLGKVDWAAGLYRPG